MKPPTSASYAFLVTCVLFACFYIYGHFNFYQDPGSIFFDSNRFLERHYSLHREIEANAFQREAFSLDHPSSPRHWRAGKDATICGVFITVGRKLQGGQHPLELAVTSSLAGLTKPEREDFDLHIYFANTNLDVHPLYNSTFLDLADHVGSAQDTATPEQFQQLEQLEKEGQLGRKIALDFSYALRYAYSSSSSPYVGIFEGDILLADGWFARSRLALRAVDELTNGVRDRWLDMRLFNEERNIGWASHDILGNNVPIIILGLSTVTLGILFTIRRRSKTGSRVFTNGFLVVVCGITIPLFVVFFFQAGKSSVIPRFPGVKVQQWGCCTQGIIVPREQVLRLADEMARRASNAPDIIVKDFAMDQGLLRFTVDPVQIQHLGLQSQISPERQPKNAPWSTSFEKLRADRLKKDHRRMVKELYEFDMLS